MSAARMKGPPIGTRLEGGYRLTRFLGTGGMSVVYEGQKDDEQTVAIKLLLGQLGR